MFIDNDPNWHVRIKALTPGQNGERERSIWPHNVRLIGACKVYQNDGYLKP